MYTMPALTQVLRERKKWETGGKKRVGERNTVRELSVLYKTGAVDCGRDI